MKLSRFATAVFAICIVYQVGCRQQIAAISGPSSREAKLDLIDIARYYHEFVDDQVYRHGKHYKDAGPQNAKELMGFDYEERDLPFTTHLKEVKKRCRDALNSANYVVGWGFSLEGAPEKVSHLILAYHKDVPVSGGYVSYAHGLVRLVTAEEFEKIEKVPSLQKKH